jgi:tetratricopeptide (TPR) repeat protein
VSHFRLTYTEARISQRQQTLPDTTGHFPTMSASNPTSGGKRLDSWKEIAAFFGRDERTVNRWEKLGLPVHRLPGTKGRVYAYTEELSAWLSAPKNDLAPIGDSPASLPLSQASGLIVIKGGGNAEESGRSPIPPGLEIRTRPTGRHKATMRVAAVVLLSLGAFALVLFPLRGNRTLKTADHAAATVRTAPGGGVLASTPAHDPQAEQLYLKGRYYWNKRTPDDLNKALDYFMQAVVHDPNYAQAYVGLADCYNLMREYTRMPSSEAYPRALAAAKRAVELDDQSSEAHASLAYVSFFGMWDRTTGEREFRRAIDLNPNNPAPHHWYANALLALHRFPEAQREIDRAQALDPASTSILADRGNILGVAGQSDEGLSLLKQMETRDPAFRSVHLYLKFAYARKRDYQNFIAEMRMDALLVHDDSALTIATAAEKGFAAGGLRGMLEAMLKLQEKLYAGQSVPPTAVAWTLSLLGRKAEALRYLQAAYDQRDGSLLFVETYPEFDSLQDEPAYRNLLARMNLPAPTVP